MARTEKDTPERIIDAALETVREEGFSGTTARAIALRGGFNQALIFYHFGSVHNLLVEAFKRQSAESVARYRAAAADVSSLSDLVSIARRLHDEDLADGSVTAVTQLMAAAASDPELGRTILDRFDDWIKLVEDALGRAVTDNPLADMVPPREAAYTIAAMFLGIELMTRMDPERSEANAVFDMMSNMASMIERMLPDLTKTVKKAKLVKIKLD